MSELMTAITKEELRVTERCDVLELAAEVLPSWPMQTPWWIIHDMPTEQLLRAALYLWQKK